MAPIGDIDSDEELQLLSQVAHRQAVLSSTANLLKRRLDSVRFTCFCLAVLGAALAAIASGMAADDYRVYLTWPATGMLALGTFLGGRLLGQEAISLHVRARLAAEALKREAYLFATGASNYRDPSSRRELLFQALNDVNARVASVSLHERRATSCGGSCPQEFLDTSEYIEQRIVKQIEYYRNRAAEMKRASRILHGAEFALGASATVITAVAAVSQKGDFDIASLTAVFAMLAAIVVTHLQAGRYDDQISTFRITANRLDAYKATVASSTPIGQISETVEQIIAGETASWQTLWLEKH